MKAGFSTADITLSLGMERPGGYSKSYVDRIHDPLKSRAAVFDDGRERIAIVGIDSLVVSEVVTAAVRLGVEKRCGIAGDHLLIAASHTHNAGPLFGLEPDKFAEAPELIRELISKHSVNPDPLYVEMVVGKTITAVCEADRKKEEVLLCAGSGCEAEAAFNRRFRMKNGRVYTHPGKGNPDILEPAGPIDPEVGVVGAWSADGRLLGCIVNYACHGTTLYAGATADWIYYLEGTIKGVMGADAEVVFLNGACGDVTQIDNLNMRENESGERWARLVGTRVGAEALKVLVSAEKGDLSPVGAAVRKLSLARRRPRPERVEKSRQIVGRDLTGAHPDTEWIFAKELLIADYVIGREPRKEVEVQALQIGPVVLLTNPAEYFCVPGMGIKKRSPFPLTFVVELANGSAGYVPDRDAFSASGGGYETAITSYSNLEAGAADLIADASVELASAMTPGELPQGAAAPPFPGPWAYGLLGPDLD